MRADDVLKLTNGREQIIPDVRLRDGAATLFVSDQVNRPGTYRLMKKDSLVQLLSFNNNAQESDMHYMKPTELEKIAGKGSNVLGPVSVLVKNKINQSDLTFQLWKLCLILALIFLGIEILLIRFYKTNNRLTPTTN